MCNGENSDHRDHSIRHHHLEAQNEKTVETQYRVCNSFNSIIERDTFEIQEGGLRFQNFFALRMSHGRPVLEGKDLFPYLKVPLDVRCLGMK